MNVRTRFAPSPTGYLHVGGVRTALFAWLVARKANGKFILRLEDTDKAREVQGSDQHIMDSLGWLGLDWDEGPDKPGPLGPYRQSERLKLYEEWGRKLLEAGRAYADPYTVEELDRLREQAKANKQPFLFRAHRPENPPVWDGSQPLRFKSEPSAYQWHDEVMGDLSAGEEAIDDFILIKSDGYPTYNFAHVIDDHLMQISHVIRSQEFLPSVPKFLNLHDALGLNWKQIAFATLPYVMGPDGNKKLSKRDGAKDILDYAKEDYLPGAMLNYLASLGWNDGSEQEVFSREELIGKFDLSRVQKSGARFDEEKLKWMNWQHFKRAVEQDGLASILSSSQLTPVQKEKLSAANLSQAAVLATSKAGTPDEFYQQLSIFTDQPPAISGEVLSELELTPEEGDEQARLALDTLTKLDKFDAPSIEAALRRVMKEHQFKPRQFLNLIRWAVSGQRVSPSLFDMLAVLGPQQTQQRLEQNITPLAS